MKKYLAELVGTFGLTLAVVLSVHSNAQFALPTPLIASLTLMLFVYAIGHISGSHINPAVTIGQWSVGKIKTIDAAFYIVAQFIGAMAAAGLVTIIIPAFAVATAQPEQPFALGAEAMGMFLFAFGIAAVVEKRVSTGASGFVVGGSLLLGLAVSSLSGASGILNPAVAFGLKSFSTAYIIGPLVGAVAGMITYRLIDGMKK